MLSHKAEKFLSSGGFMFCRVPFDSYYIITCYNMSQALFKKIIISFIALYSSNSKVLLLYVITYDIIQLLGGGLYAGGQRKG